MNRVLALFLSCLPAAAASLVVEARKAGRTVVFSSHVLSEVEEVCDRAAILRQGRVVHLQTLSELAWFGR